MCNSLYEKCSFQKVQILRQCTWITLRESKSSKCLLRNYSYADLISYNVIMIPHQNHLWHTILKRYSLPLKELVESNWLWAFVIIWPPTQTLCVILHVKQGFLMPSSTIECNYHLHPLQVLYFFSYEVHYEVECSMKEWVYSVNDGYKALLTIESANFNKTQWILQNLTADSFRITLHLCVPSSVPYKLVTSALLEPYLWVYRCNA